MKDTTILAQIESIYGSIEALIIDDSMSDSLKAKVNNLKSLVADFKVDVKEYKNKVKLPNKKGKNK